jgi:hypothetical protein
LPSERGGKKERKKERMNVEVVPDKYESAGVR